ncbi:MAG: hypothetical protein AMXMBFR81_28260 [Chthonomonas sp.]|nr:DUF4097 family beta strand repeat protein [Fimbriimonadaceae bacterium]
MVKDEIRKIASLVQEGKLSPEDAADLIEAFARASSQNAAPQAETQAEEPTTATEEPAPQAQSSEPEAPGETAAEAPKAETSTNGCAGDAKCADPFQRLIDSIEKLGKEVGENVNWDEIAKTAKVSASKGFQQLRASVEQIAKNNWGLFSSQELKEVVLPLSVTEGKLLRIENPAGTVRVHGGQTDARVKASARIRGRDAEDAKKKAETYVPVLVELEDAILIRQPEMGGLTVDLDIYVTGPVPVEIKTQSGDLHVTDTKSSVKVMTQSGDVFLKGLDGTVDINLHSGDLVISDVVSSSVAIENKTGDIELKRVVGNINARCASGNFSMKECSGKTITVESVTGDVRLDLVEPIVGVVSVRTVNGNATLAISDGSDSRVSLSTLRGTVSCDLELQDLARIDQRVTGRLGEGTGSIDVSAVNGDIVLRMRDHLGSAE